MPNIASLLKAEITRLSRREIKKELAAVRKANVAYRHDIAALKRQVTALEHKAGQLAKHAGRQFPGQPAALPDRPVRFVAKGLRSMRKRLGLSAAELAALVGVSEQSVYNWETKKATPRKEQFARLIALRGVGKREIQRRLLESARTARQDRR